MKSVLDWLFPDFIHRYRRRTMRVAISSTLLESLEQRLMLSSDPLQSPLDVPAYHSLPSAPVSLYLDFDGDNTPSWAGMTPGVTPALDTDGDPLAFSNSELVLIDHIWERVSEFFSPFNIDVTTQDPGAALSEQTMRVVVGGDGAWEGTAGGVSEVDSFSDPNRVNLAFAFQRGDGTEAGLISPKMSAVAIAADEQTISVIIAHEAGHAFGLRHQRVFNPDGSLESEYNGGDGLRGPIMGGATSGTRALWWLGPSDSAEVNQNDLTILTREANGFGYRPDEAGETVSSAVPLSPSTSGGMTARGVITTVNDVDTYRFTQTTPGHASIRLDAAERSAMLDADVDVLDVHGNVLASLDTPSLGETLTVSLPMGQFFVAVHSHGSQGDIGQYTLTVHADAQVPVLGKLTEPKVATPDDQITLNVKGAVDRDGKVQSVTFYVDTDGDGKFDPQYDTPVGQVTQFTKKGSATLKVSAGVFSSGANTVFAVPRDNTDADGTALATVVRIQSPLHLTATPKVIVAGQPLTLKADDVILFGTTITSVSFYRDVNHNGRVDRRTDQLVSVDHDGIDGWSTNVPTTDLPTGNLQFIAVAAGSNRRKQTPGTTEIVVGREPSIASVRVFHEPQLPQSIFSVEATGVSDADNSISLVDFYLDSNGNHQFDADDESIGTAHEISGTTAKIRFAPSLPAGNYQIFAVAEDPSHHRSAPATTTF
jgi:hypothetical protein